LTSQIDRALTAAALASDPDEILLWLSVAAAWESREEDDNDVDQPGNPPRGDHDGGRRHGGGGASQPGAVQRVLGVAGDSAPVVADPVDRTTRRHPGIVVLEAGDSLYDVIGGEPVAIVKTDATAKVDLKDGDPFPPDHPLFPQVWPPYEGGARRSA